MEDQSCPMCNIPNLGLDKLTQKEKLGCVALWLNALYTITYLAENKLSDEEVPCRYCPYYYKCPSKIKMSGSQTVKDVIPIILNEIAPTPLIFKTALEPLIGENTVIGGVFPIKREDTLLFLKHMVGKLEDNAH